jgi:hypothetical protein
MHQGRNLRRIQATCYLVQIETHRDMEFHWHTSKWSIRYTASFHAASFISSGIIKMAPTLNSTFRYSRIHTARGGIAAYTRRICSRRLTVLTLPGCRSISKSAESASRFQ